MTKILNIVAFILSLASTVVGFAVGGFIGGFLTGFGLSMTFVSAIAYVVRIIIARRLLTASTQIAGMLGPQGAALLSRLSNK